MPGRALRADAVRNRRAILDAAAEMFAHNGVDVPLDAIAARAGVGAGTVHRHFPTKAALVKAVLAARLETLAALATPAEGDPGTQFIAFLTAAAESARDNMALRAALDGSLGIEGEAAARRLAEAFAELLRAAQRADAVRPDVTAAEVHAILAGVIAAESHLPPARRGLGLEIAVTGLRARG